MPTTPEAPIVAVTVYPAQARVTRRARARLGGDNRFVIGGLPKALQRESVRVTGTGAASITAVDTADERHSEETRTALADLIERQRSLQRELDEVTDAQTVADARARMLQSITSRAATAFAKGLVDGTAAPSQVTETGDALAEQLTEVLARVRELGEREATLADQLAAATRAVEAHQNQATPDRTAVTIDLEARDQGEAEVEIELSYVVADAGWTSSYDIRVDDGLALTWYAVVTQHTGEDWPEADLALSTARPAASIAKPELKPWYLDRAVPQPGAPEAAVAAPAAGARRMRGHADATAAAELAARTATVEHGLAAATYRPARPAAVPSDGTGHRTTITELALEVRLDHVTAPVRDEHAYLRAMATNASEHTLPPGRAAIFHRGEFVGATRLKPWAPGEEVELALGIDDRIRVGRKLTRRTANTATLSGTRRREAEYRITVGNHGTRTAAVTVLDQLPVSRDGGITVKALDCTPAPDERTELGELTWRLGLEPGDRGEVTFAFRVDVAKGVELSGWRE